MNNIIISLSVFLLASAFLLVRRELRKRSGIQVHSLSQVSIMLFFGFLTALALGFALSYK